MSQSEDREPRKGLRRRLLDWLGARGSKRRRNVMVAGGVLAAIAVTVLVPGYIATRPSYLTRYPSLAGAHETWTESVHASVACQQCHIQPGFAPRTAYNARMLGEFYLSLVMGSREPQLLKRPLNAACGSCHIDLRTVSPTGDLKIPHRAHVNALEMQCVTCHEFLVHELSPEGQHKPRMEACLECHDGERAKNACTTCHTDKAAPEGHQAKDWVVVHALRQSEEDCESCHAWTDDWCVECHTRKPGSHGTKWRSAHPVAVENRRNCEACHQGDFCVRCHGEVPQLNISSAPKLVK